MSAAELVSRWWRVGLTIAVTLLFCLHLYNLFSQLLSRPTASSFTLVDDIPPKLPAVTVCPSVPFPAHALVRLGINTSCDTLFDCDDVLIQLDGLPEDILLQELWNASLLPLSNYVRSSSIHGIEATYSESSSWPHWLPTMTAIGPCWTLTAPAQEPGDTIEPLRLYIESQIPCSTFQLGVFFLEDPSDTFPACNDVAKNCKTSCLEERLAYTAYERFHSIFIVLHPPNELPVLLDTSNTIKIYDSASKDLTVETSFSLRETHLLESEKCISDPNYSFSKCVSLCQEEYLKRPYDCISSPNYAVQPNKTCILQFLQFRQDFLNSLGSADKHSDVIKCKDSCKPPCINSQFTFITKQAENFYFPEGNSKAYKFILQASAPYTESVVEERIYTSSKFLSDLGGSLGLYFGAGLVTVCQWIYVLIRKLVTRMKKIGNRKDAVIKSDQMVYPDYSDSTENHLKNIWMMSGTCLCLMFLATHTIQSTLSYLEYNTLSAPNFVKTQSFPGLTLCPDIPFDLATLSHYGLSLLNDSRLEELCDVNGNCDRHQLISQVLATLPGLWLSNLSLNSIWNISRPLNATVTRYEYDQANGNGNVIEILTTMGKCFLFSPGQDDSDTVSIDIFLAESMPYMKQELDFFNDLYGVGISYTVTMMLHPLHLSPNYLGESAITHRKNTYEKLALDVRVTNVKKVSTPKSKCQGKPYSQADCVDQCSLREMAKAVGCRLPYLEDTTLPLCDSASQYKMSFKGKDSQPPQETRKKCEDTCDPECDKVYYVLKQQTFDEGRYDNPDIAIKKPLHNSLEIKEYLMTSLTSYLSEMGGIIGLYLGMSLIDIMTWLIWPITESLKHRVSHKLKSSFHGFTKILIWLLTLLLVVFSIMRLETFLTTPRTYTKFSDQVNKWKDFPGISICRWPPFNLTSLTSLGMKFDVEEYCTVDPITSDYYCTNEIYDFMNNLPGLENESVSVIWEAASWNLSDILHAYSVNGKRYTVEGSSSLHWKSATMSLNRCFTFVPPDDKEDVSDLDLYLSSAGFKHYYEFSDLPTIEEALQYTMANDVSMYRAHNLIKLHSPGDTPKFGDVEYKYPMYLNRNVMHLVLVATLTEVSKYKGTYQCREEEGYSQYNCVQECLLQAIIKQEKCKLPFASSFKVESCNITSYMKFPKYLDRLSKKIHNYKEVKMMCDGNCLPKCRNYNYMVREEKKNFRSFYYPNRQSRVTVTMAKSYHDLYEEVPALTWSSFLAEIGGVAGILTGVSLLTLSEFLVTGIAWLWARARGRIE